ncbi:MAG: class I SAM-dependent methyltransferase [Micropruina sp.]|uniref:class I SAM-dependent methyltransferase n=1 Tax=Micropruina sp. TaxID=2737536 RepID=UPI0039E4006A
MSPNDHRSQHPHQHSHAAPSLLETLLELDSVVHQGLLDDALDAVAQAAPTDAVRRVLDVGAGTGAATFRLSDRYPEAEVIALDASRAMTRRIAAHAERAGNRRVRAVNQPLLATASDPASVDLVWAASVFHEFDQPARELAVLSELIRPGGVLAILEMDAPPHVLPTGYRDLESRLRRLAQADVPPPEWTDQLREAGFELLAEHRLGSDQDLPADGPGGAYARAELHRLALHAAAGLDADENAALSRLLHGGLDAAVLPRVHIRGTRSLWIARRP